MSSNLTRRTLLAATAATGAAVSLGATPAAARTRLTLPAPTGPHRIGVVPLHLIDRFRQDPLGGEEYRRQLMASVWYPAARDGRRYPLAPWLPDAPARALLQDFGVDPDAFAAPVTAGHEGAPVLHGPGRMPVILFSHGNNGSRGEATVIVQELASHGYVVVTMDHTYDAYSEFPDGRLTVPFQDELIPPYDTPWGNAFDARFVLDRIEDLAAGRNPDAGGRRLPVGLGAAIDLRRIGMFGWSKGATATAITMTQDRRVKAGLALDGPMQAIPEVYGLDRPFMLMTAEFSRVDRPDLPAEESVKRFWRELKGWRLTIQADGADHSSYTDPAWLVPQLPGESPGALPPVRAAKIQQAYPLAFFDRHLRGGRGRLLDGPAQAFPEVKFIA